MTIEIKVIPVGIHEWWLWTNDFDECVVLPFWIRLLMAPIYGFMFMYYCIKGLPIKVSVNYGDNK